MKCRYHGCKEKAQWNVWLTDRLKTQMCDDHKKNAENTSTSSKPSKRLESLVKHLEPVVA